MYVGEKATVCIVGLLGPPFMQEFFIAQPMETLKFRDIFTYYVLDAEIPSYVERHLRSVQSLQTILPGEMEANFARKESS